jgi:hypothetical protein
MLRTLLKFNGLIARSWALSWCLYRLRGIRLIGSPREEIWYFAYGASRCSKERQGGSNLCPFVMAHLNAKFVACASRVVAATPVRVSTSPWVSVICVLVPICVMPPCAMIRRQVRRRRVPRAQIAEVGDAELQLLVARARRVETVQRALSEARLEHEGFVGLRRFGHRCREPSWRENALSGKSMT